ncbi:ubiquitin carboxyl-terminal hydrolase 7 [Biomphalaria pfeifferi]|uniref:ubiquitinyl hydrolase 1 n=1 Tax=Biomphalaria pfeifferi TaxID=112525 RepID=A0AAD8BEK5_BIOPF|nr:ubiquitin carboxyl-terminal hydrolase 7 [Biomphalaria pfeifferi]
MALIDWLYRVVFSFVVEYSAFLVVDKFVKSVLKNTTTDEEKRTIWMYESWALFIECLLFYLIYQVPYFLILFTSLTIGYTQLSGRSSFSVFLANLRAHWENHMQHEESLKQIERQKQQQQHLQQQALGIAGLNHSTAADLGNLSGQGSELGYGTKYQLFNKQSHLNYPPNATVVPGQERPAYSLELTSVTYRDVINKGSVLYPVSSTNWNNSEPITRVDSHSASLMYRQSETNSNALQFQDNNIKRTLWSNVNLQRRSLHSDTNAKIQQNPVSSIKSKLMNIMRFGNTAPMPVGLTNNGQNMCFINSVIQCLARSPFLVDYLTADAAKESECTVAESELLSTLAELLDILTIDPPSSEHKVFSAVKFCKAASMLNPSLVSPPENKLAQQDAAEFLMWLLSILHHILNKNRQALECDSSMIVKDDKFSSPRLANLKLIYGDLNANRIRELKDQCRREIAVANGLENESYAEAIQRLSDLEWLTHKQANDTIIDNLFTGQLVEAYHSLEHGHISVNLQAFNVLPVPIAAPRYSAGRLVMLEDCFTSFCNIEILTENPSESHNQHEPLIQIPNFQKKRTLGRINLGATPVSRKPSHLGLTDLPSPIYQPLLQPTISVIQPMSPPVGSLISNESCNLDHAFKTSTPIGSENAMSLSQAKLQRRCLLRQLPECLIIQLMRFRYDSSENVSTKVKTSVSIRLNHFNLKDAIYDTVTQRSDLTAPAAGFVYELYGLCLHLGGDSTSHGHYISYCLIGTKWYRMDDENVNEVNMDYQLNSEEIKENAYLLFYRRMNSKT